MTISKELTAEVMRQAIAMKMAASVNNPATSEQYAKSVDQYAAFTGQSTTSVQERDAVVRAAMAEYSEYFEDLI